MKWRREIGQLGCLADISRFVTLLADPDARCLPDVVLGTADFIGQCVSSRICGERFRRVSLFLYWFEPRLLPKKQASSLAAAVCLTVATEIQMDRIGEASTSNRIDRVAGLVRPLINFEALSAILKHLRHEGELIQPAILIERPQDLFLAPNFHPITCT